jgi:hypothetical protein
MNLAVKRRAFSLLALPAVALVIAAGCVRSQKPRPSAPVVTAATPSLAIAYVGSEACGTCHVAEWRSHQKTYHAHTFGPMTVSGLGKNAPPEGHLSGTISNLSIRDDRYVLVSLQTGKEVPLDYAVGSGKQGMTFIKIANDTSVMEMRKSYHPHTGRWYSTPGQEGFDSNPDGIGMMHQGMDARKCILCHAVTAPPEDLHPEPRFMGVGCESCHGPGSAHLAALKVRPMADLKMEDLKRAGGRRINQLCGACHRTPEEAQSRPDLKPLTQRFMPYGLSLSRCFQKSSDRLTCITCHNPHTDAGTDHRAYETICLGCHSKTPAPSPDSWPAHAPSPANAQKTVCPVDPRAGCIDCHMPTRRVFTTNPNPIAMADHWIKIYPKLSRHDRDPRH